MDRSTSLNSWTVEFITRNVMRKLLNIYFQSLPITKLTCVSNRNYASTKEEFAVADDHLLFYVPDKYVTLNNYASINICQ